MRFRRREQALDRRRRSVVGSLVSILLVILALALSAGAADLVVESADSGGATLIAFDRVLWTPGTPEGIWVLCGSVAIAAIALTAAVARIRGRRLERTMAAELDERWDELSHQDAGVIARNELLSWRIAELQSVLNDLVAKRDAALSEMVALKERSRELREVVRQEAAASPSGHEEHVVVVPESQAPVDLPESESAEPNPAPGRDAVERDAVEPDHAFAQPDATRDELNRLGF
jgi:hypothetical protein